MTIRAFLLLVLWLLPAAVRAQSIDEHFPPIPTPPPAGTYPPAVQEAIEEGYAHLARVESPADEAALEAAKASFQRALREDPRNVHAWNGMGIYELGKDEGWLILLESFKKLLNRDHISMATKAFQQALVTDRAFHPARYNLALAYRQARGRDNWREASGELERLMKEAPGTGEAPLLLALTYRDLGDLEAMRQALERAPDSEALPGSVPELLLAWASFTGGRPEEGAASYWRGVDAIATEHEALLFWHDIRPIASPEENAEFDALPLAERKAYLQAFWRRLGDQAFVPADERLAEHYRRLEHVYRHFRIDLAERRHYSAIAAYVPPWQTGFDDRGVIYLRHGPPDAEATYSGPDVERNVSWKYERPGRDPLVLHFVSDEDVGDFKLVKQLSDAVIRNATKMTGETLLSNNPICHQPAGRRCDSYDQRILAAQGRRLQALYSSRGHLEPLYDRLAMRLDPQLLDEERSGLALDVQLATHTRTFRPPRGESLRYPVRAVVFRNPNGRAAVAFYYALPASQVDVARTPDGRSAVDYRYQLMVEPIADGAPIRAEEEVRLVAGSIPRDPGVLLPRVRWMELAPAQYQFGLRVTDLSSGRSGLVQGDVVIDDLAGGGPTLSGVVLATGVTPASDTTDPFVRWGRWRVVPLVSQIFRRTQPVFAYYEAYDLARDPSGVARYRTTYTLAAGNPDRNVVARFFSAVGGLLTGGQEKGSISYAFEQSGEADPALEFFSLDVSKSEPGEYVLTVEIEDLVAGTKARRSTGLTLVE